MIAEQALKALKARDARQNQLLSSAMRAREREEIDEIRAQLDALSAKTWQDYVALAGFNAEATHHVDQGMERCVLYNDGSVLVYDDDTKEATLLQDNESICRDGHHKATRMVETWEMTVEFTTIVRLIALDGEELVHLKARIRNDNGKFGIRWVHPFDGTKHGDLSECLIGWPDARDLMKDIFWRELVHDIHEDSTFEQKLQQSMETITYNHNPDFAP